MPVESETHVRDFLPAVIKTRKMCMGLKALRTSVLCEFNHYVVFEFNVKQFIRSVLQQSRKDAFGIKTLHTFYTHFPRFFNWRYTCMKGIVHSPLPMLKDTIFVCIISGIRRSQCKGCLLIKVPLAVALEVKEKFKTHVQAHSLINLRNHKLTYLNLNSTPPTVALATAKTP